MKNKKSYLKLLANFLLVILVIGIVVYVLRNSMAEIFEGLKKTTPEIAFAVLLLGIVYQMVEGVNISRLAEDYQPKFDWVNGFFCSAYVAFYRVITFGSGTSISEVLYYRKKGVETSESVGIAALHMVFYKLALIIFSLIGLILHFDIFLGEKNLLIISVIAGIVVSSLIIVALLVISSNEKLHHWMIKFLKRFLKSEAWEERLAKVSNQIDDMQLVVARTMKNPLIFIKMTLLNLFKLIFWLCIPYVILSQKHDISFTFTFTLTAFSVLLAGIIPTPAGIGSFEFVYLLLFRPYIGTGDAGSSMLLYRFATYVLPFLIGMLYVLFTKNKQMKNEILEIREDKKSKNNL